MKATPDEFALHQRLVARVDPEAPDDLARWLYFDLIRELRAKEHYKVRDDVIEEAVGTAILNYCQAPEMYNLELATLRGFLLMAAQRDARNSVARERRQYQHQLRHVSIYDDDDERDIVDETQDLELYAWTQELREQVLQAFSQPIDRAIAEFMMDRVPGTEPYIELLKSQLDGLPKSEQVKRVNRHKKRIAWHLRHIGEQYND
jgi:hypothetical protein